jgi:hypothetical protein
MKLSICLTGMTKNSSFLRVWPFLWAIAHCFGVMGGIYIAHDTQYMFERHDQKLVIFTFSGHFRELLSTVLGFWGDFQGPWHLVVIWQAWPKTRHFFVYGRFCELFPTVLGFWGIYMARDTRYMFERHDQKLTVFAF